MISFEFDRESLSRLDEIKENQLHNLPMFSSGFITEFVRYKDKYPVSMLYSFNNETMIGWASLRFYKEIKGYDVYDAASFIHPSFRRKGLATKCLRRIVRNIKQISKNPIKITAQSYTREILKQYYGDDSNMKISYLYDYS